MQSFSNFLMKTEPIEIKNISAGEILFDQNSKAWALYVVKQGRIKLVRNTQDGNPVVLYIAISGNSLAEAALFSKTYHCQAIADIESEVLCFDKIKLLQQLSADPAASLNFIESLAQQVQSLRLLIELRNIRSPRNRILQYLLSMSDENRRITIKSSLKDIAYQLGMTHETLYRKLSELEKQNLIERKKNIIQLKNI